MFRWIPIVALAMIVTLAPALNLSLLLISLFDSGVLGQVHGPIPRLVEHSGKDRDGHSAAARQGRRRRSITVSIKYLCISMSRLYCVQLYSLLGMVCNEVSENGLVQPILGSQLSQHLALGPLFFSHTLLIRLA